MTRQGALLSWPLWASLGIHVVGLATASSVVGLTHHEAERVLIPVEMIQVEPPAPPEKPKMPRPASRPSAPAPATPATAPALIQDPTPPAERAPEPAAAAPERRYMASAAVPGPTLPIPGPSGAGGLLSPAPEIPGAPGGGPRAGATLARGGEGVTSFARPRGGYQTTPHYPETARRDGVEGTVTLRFEVLASGKVGTVQVQRSAGRADMDRAAVEAVRTWLFEPAHRGKEAVAVWVTLPVRFELNAR